MKTEIKLFIIGRCKECDRIVFGSCREGNWRQNAESIVGDIVEGISSGLKIYVHEGDYGIRISQHTMQDHRENCGKR